MELGEATVGHCRFDPGWRWSVDVGHLFGRTSCPIRHIGYCISGAARVEMDDGQALDVGPDTAFDVPPGHDHWVTLERVGDAAWRNLLATHNARLRMHLNVNGGRKVKTTGDGVLAVFDSPTRAVRAGHGSLVP